MWIKCIKCLAYCLAPKYSMTNLGPKSGNILHFLQAVLTAWKVLSAPDPFSSLRPFNLYLLLKLSLLIQMWWFLLTLYYYITTLSNWIYTIFHQF